MNDVGSYSWQRLQQTNQVINVDYALSKRYVKYSEAE